MNSHVADPAGTSRTRRSVWYGLAAVTLIAGASCGSPTAPCTTCGSSDGPAVLVGAGDIAACGQSGIQANAQATATLLDRIAGTVFAAGDNVYDTGSPTEYRDCYDPTWGRHKGRTWPVPGNHDYETPGAEGYYGYFGAAAGPAGLGYWRRSLGTWTVIGLNSEIPVGAGSAQLQWLRRELATNQAPCTVAIWHRPLFSSGPNGDQPDMIDVWRTLYEFDADLIINGHDHLYERFGSVDPDGRPDAVRGMKQFTVGTGGAVLYNVASRKPHSQLVISAWGVAKFTLRPGAFDWEFRPIDPAASSDFGTRACH